MVVFSVVALLLVFWNAKGTANPVTTDGSHKLTSPREAKSASHAGEDNDCSGTAKQGSVKEDGAKVLPTQSLPFHLRTSEGQLIKLLPAPMRVRG